MGRFTTLALYTTYMMMMGATIFSLYSLADNAGYATLGVPAPVIANVSSPGFSPQKVSSSTKSTDFPAPEFTEGDQNSSGYLLSQALSKVWSNSSVPAWAFDREKVGKMGRVFDNAGRVQFPRLTRSQKGKKSSQSMEDMYAYNTFFFGRAHGTFLETGALDGWLYSNTVRFEQLLGWSGMLIEASPHNFELLKVHRVGQIMVHAALCQEAKVVHWADASKAGRWGGAGAIGGIVEFMAPRFKERFHKGAGGINVAGVPISCVPLHSILEMFGLKRVNYFSLDVEGGELEILKSIDFTKVTFDVVNIEADGMNQEKDMQVRALMIRNGYRLHAHLKSGNNDWFVREGFNASANPMCSDNLGCTS